MTVTTIDTLSTTRDFEAAGLARKRGVRERIVARNPVPELHELPQPRLPCVPERLHVHAGLLAGQHRQKADQQHLVQVVACGIAAPVGPQLLEKAHKDPSSRLSVR